MTSVPVSLDAMVPEGRLGGISFIAEECSEPALGYMIEGSALGAVLHAAASLPEYQLL